MKRTAGFSLILGIILLLEVACRLGLLDRVYFPPPSMILASLVDLLQGWDFWSHVGVTVMRAGIGYIIAMAVAIPTGLLMGKFRLVNTLLEPIVDILRPMPSAAVIPVAIILFGIEDKMKIVVIIFGAVWPTIISTIDGIRGVDPLVLDTGRLLQLTPSQMLLRIALPAASPTIATGMRISLAIALILAVTSEMIAGSNGLGYFILDAERGFAFGNMYAGIVMLGLIGYLSSRLFVLAERRMLFWHYVPRAEAATVEANPI
jgi:ABC-type nitrate/sulfonate/bicarbonate transport system permease component